MNKVYSCLCGKTFDTPNKFNAHKSNCETHLREKHKDNYEEFIASQVANRTKNSGKRQHEESIKRQQLMNDEWLQANHKCQTCGKTMTQKYGSGRFCSKSCANSHARTTESRLKTSTSIKYVNNIKNNEKVNSYLLMPNHCEVCNKELSYEKRHRKTCSVECNRKLLSIRTIQQHPSGGYRRGCGNRKHGYYKGYYCDSSWELAYVIYNLDHNIPFERNTKSYTYIDLDDTIHQYYPDFIQDGYIIEIKGLISDTVYCKIAAVYDYPVKLLMYDDIKHMITYVQDKYNVKDISVLYES